MRLRVILAVALSSVLSACFPYRYTERPGITGQVVRLAGSAPQTAATVRATFAHPGENHVSVEMVTLADGSFHYPAKTFFGAFFISQNRGQPGVCTIEVTAEGHEREVREFQWWLTGPSIVKIGKIELKKTSER